MDFTKCRMGRRCAELGLCVFLNQITDRPLDDGGENEKLIAEKHGRQAGLNAVYRHANSLVTVYQTCQCRRQVAIVIQQHEIAIKNMKG